MIYIGILLFLVAAIGIVSHRVTAKFVVIEEFPHDNTRIIRKFVIYKLLQNGRCNMSFGILQTRDIVQMQSIGDEDKWIDICWAR